MARKDLTADEKLRAKAAAKFGNNGTYNKGAGIKPSVRNEELTASQRLRIKAAEVERQKRYEAVTAQRKEAEERHQEHIQTAGTPYSNRFGGLRGDENMWMAPIERYAAGKEVERLETDLAHAEEMYGTYSDLYGSWQTSPEEKAQALEWKNRFGAQIEDINGGALVDAKTKQAEATANYYATMNRRPGFNAGVAAGEAIDNGFKTSEIEGAVTNWEFFTDAEKDIYNYLLGTGGEEAAEAYWKYMQEPAQQRLGNIYTDRVQSIDSDFGRFLAERAYGIGAGVENALGGFMQATTEEELPTSGTQFGYYQMGEGKTGLDKIIYELGYQAGNMLPSMLLSGGLSAAGAPAKLAQLAGSGAMGFSAGGNAYKQGLDMGMTAEQAKAYGRLIGASEGGLQYALGGISALGGTSGRFAEAVKGIENGFLRFIAQTGGSMVSEATEEGLQAILDPIFRNAASGAEINIDWSEVAYNALMGGLMGGVFEAPGNAAEAITAGRGDAMYTPNSFKGENFAFEGFVPANVSQPIENGNSAEIRPDSPGLAQAREQLRQNTFAAAEKSFGKEGYAAFEAEAASMDNPADLFGEMSRAYNDGFVNRHAASYGSLSSAQYEAMFEAGRADAAASIKSQMDKRGKVFSYKDAGIDMSDDVTKKYAASLNAEDSKSLNAAAKAFGLKIRFADSVAGGDANAEIRNGIITIEKGNPNPLRFLFGHEVTHRMQELAPQEYARLREAAAATGDWLDATVRKTIANYNSKGMNISHEAAIDEAIADYMGEIIENSTELERFIARFSGERTLLQKLRDVIRDIAVALSGSEQAKRLRVVEKRLSEAMEAAAKQAQSNAGATKNAAQTSDGTKLSIKNVNGKQVVWIENNALTNKQLANHAEVAAYIAQHIGEVYTIIESGQKVYIGEDLPGEYTHSKYTDSIRQRNPALLKAKNKATSDLGLLIETANNRRWEKTRHQGSKDAKYGMYRYDSSFAFPVKDIKGNVTNVRAYDTELLIRNASDGKKYLYDIVNIKENTTDAIDLQKRETRLAAHRAASHGSVTNANVPQDVDIVKVEKAVKEGKAISATDEVLFSLKMDSKFMADARSANDKFKKVSPAVMKKAAEARRAIADIFNDPELADSLGLPPDIIGNTYIPNGSYSGTEENTTVCIRSISADALMDAVAEHLGRPLTVQDTITISQELMRFTDKPECLYCYVAMDRKAHREFLGSYLKQRDDAISNIRNGMSREEAYEKFRDGRKDTKPMRDRFNMWLRNMGGEMITPEDLASYANMEKAMERNPALKTQINDALKYAQSASWAKKRMSYSAYNGHVLKWKWDRIQKLNSNYGLRMYSFSDFSPAFILENMQMITDAAVRDLKVLAYTKELDFVRIFAGSGMNINISVFGYDYEGGVAMDAMQGADWAEAQALRQQYPNVGCTFVATNDGQVNWALEQDWIDVIIPFHMVRTGSKVASYFNWKNYTAMSADTKAEGWTKADAKHILPPVHQNDKAKYLEACRKNHLTPRFNDWVEHPNYMKLVNETRRSERETKAVQPIFDVEAAKASIEDMRKRGGYYTPIGGTEENMRDIAAEIGDSIEGRFSLKDSDGRELSRQQQEYFKDSKVRDENGNLLKVYHGTNQGDFTEFLWDKTQRADGGFYGRGHYFTTRRGMAELYGSRVIEGYLNITNPFVWQEEINNYDGREPSDVLAKNFAARINMARVFPELFANKTMTYGVVNDRTGEYEDKSIKWGDLEKEITNTAGTLSPITFSDGSVQWTYPGRFWDDHVGDRHANMEEAESHKFEAAVQAFVKTHDGVARYMTYDDQTTWTQDYGSEISDTLMSMGYDGAMQDRKGTEIVAFESNQFKNADNLSPTVNKDIRYSLKDSDTLVRDIARIQREGVENKRSDAEIQANIRAAVQEAYQSMVNTFGAIEPGENAYREVQVPSRTAKKRKVSKTVRTAMESQATPDEALPKVEELVATGEFSYEVYGDKAAVADAREYVENKGWDTSLSEWLSDVRKGVVSKRNTAVGWLLYDNAVNSGNVETAMTLLNAMVEHQRNAAQAVQATRILKKLSPETQLYGVQRSIANLQQEINDRHGKNSKVELVVDQTLAEDFIKARTDEERDAALKEIYRDIGRQMPSTFIDKFRAWRYLAMLGNPRTHGRNIAGNAAFAPVVLAKDITASAIESAVYRVSGGKTGRSKTLSIKQGVMKAAWQDYKNVADMVSGEGKYSDYANANRYIEEGRQVFKFAPLEKARRGNTKALETEDMWFGQPHYAFALAQYCSINGISAEQIRSGKGLDKAREYAAKEAQKATYRDTNQFSQAISHMGFKTVNGNMVKKGVNAALEGVLPFRKTPANILVRGLEYSPLGLVNGIKQAVWDVQKGKMTASEAIDNISAGLTGTGLLALGVYLAAQGLIRGRGSDDENEKEFEELMGHQSYALETPDGKSYTLDWLAPEALPFFIGVNLYEQVTAKRESQEAMQFKDVMAAVWNVTEPMLSMSCLQSLNDLFEAVGYASSNDMNGLMTVLSTAATSYLSQALPTIAGQIERIGETERMTTYTEKNSPFSNDMQYFFGRVSGKTPGEFQQIPYIDAWGRTESTGGFGERAFNNLLNPAYSSQIEMSAMEEMLLQLYNDTGESAVLPSRAGKYFNVGTVRKDLTAEEYVKYATEKGQLSYNLLTGMMVSEVYMGLSSADQVDAVEKVYEYANAIAKTGVSNYKLDGWVAKANKAIAETNVKPEIYIPLYIAQGNIESLKDSDGKTISNSKSLQVMQLVYATPGLTDKQRKALFEAFDVSEGIRHYNKALVEQKLREMQRKAK